MKVKNIFKIFAATTVFASISCAFAADEVCPPYHRVRAMNEFMYAYNLEGYRWTIVTKPFDYRDKEWQTIFEVILPDVEMPDSAVILGKFTFDHSPILMQPTVKTYGERTECSYAPQGVKYKVITVTPANMGYSR